MKKINKFMKRNMHWLIVGGVTALTVLLLSLGHLSENGKYITFDGKDAYIPESVKQFVEDAEAALARVMTQDRPTDQKTVTENDEPMGQGFYTDINTILSRIEADGNTDNGLGWQCSKYTAYLATGKREYSSVHTDYGPVNGKDVAAWLVNNYGFKYIDQPVKGAIGSGGFNTTYGHTAVYLYSTGTNAAMVNDANYVPLTVNTHNMNISGWVWVVPGNYTPAPAPTPTPEPTPVPEPQEPVGDIIHTVQTGETLGGILYYYGYTTNLFGDNGMAQGVADYNGIVNRGIIYPGQKIIIKTK